MRQIWWMRRQSEPQRNEAEVQSKCHGSKQQNVSQEQAANVVALDDALKRLEAIDRRQSETVELRFFGGLSIETAALLRVSPGTFMRDWTFARAWLKKRDERRQQNFGDQPYRERHGLKECSVSPDTVYNSCLS